MINVATIPRFVRCKFMIVALAALCCVPFGAQAAPVQKFLNGKLAWRNIGPTVGGRVIAVAGVPSQPNLFYMGAVDGGVWKSTSYGARWHNITDGKWKSASGSVGAIAVAASNPKVIYVGTGEADIRGDMVTGNGVYKSVDAGKTWKYIGLRDTRTTSVIVVDPHNPKIVYVASMGHVFRPNDDRGVFKSTDGGKTWHKVLYVDAKTGAIDVVIDPHHPKVLYATMWQAQRMPWKLISGGPGSGLYKSTDGGAHWTNLTRNPGLPHGVLGRMGVSIAASHPNIVYAVIQAKHGGVFRSDNGGKTWKRVNRNWSLRQRAFYYMSIYVDPTNPDTLYVPNVDGVWVSRNGGKAFSLLHMPHGDDHTVWINPNHPKILLVGNDGGATVSTDGGKNWSSEHNQPTGQFYHVAIDHEFPFNVYGAQQDEGSYEGPSSTLGGAIPVSAWHEVALGESTFIAPDPGNRYVTYGADYYTIMQRYNRQTGGRKSVSPSPIYLDGGDAARMKYRFGWTHPIFFSPNDPKKLFLASQYVMVSEDGGRTWKVISPDLTRNDPATQGPTGGPIDLDQTAAEVFPDISALSVSPLDKKLIWAGSQDGLVHVTLDGGEHWNLVTPPQLKQWATITSIEPSHVAEGTAYLTASRYMWDDDHPYVFKTTDYGRHWSAMTHGLPDDQYVFTVRQDPNEASLLFLGTANTVYVSLDGGADWSKLAAKLPHAQVRDLAVDTREGEVVAATHGRSFWILGNLALLEQLSRQAQPAADTAALFAPQAAWLTHAYGQSEHAKYRQPVGTNAPFGATVFFHLPAKYDGKTPASLTFLDAQGKEIQHYALHLKDKHAKKLPATVKDNLLPSQKKRIDDKKKTAVEPGMNRLRWNLRYADATDVIGWEPPEDTDGMVGTSRGPLVNPGRYTVVLRYGDMSYKQSFEVKLDPRLHTTPEILKQKLAMELTLHDTIDVLDKDINAAILLRRRLLKAVAAHKVDAADAAPAIKELNDAVSEVAMRDIRSSEGDVLHNVQLRSWLAYLQSSIGLDDQGPNPAQIAAFHELQDLAKKGRARLKAATAAGEHLL